MSTKRLRLTAKMPKKFDFWLHLAVLILIVFGSIMILSASVGETDVDKLVTAKTAGKQIVFVVISYALMTFFANNFTMLRAKRYTKFIGFILLGLCLATLLFPEVSGSRAWIQIPIPFVSVSLQPSEFVKVLMIVLMAITVERTFGKNYDFWTIVKVPVVYLIAYEFVIMILQPDFGSGVAIALICCVLFFVPSHKNLRKMQRMFAIIVLCLLAFTGFLLSDHGSAFIEHMPISEHGKDRFLAALNPFEDSFGSGYQLINGLYAFSKGGLFGVGLGQSELKMSYLQAASTDYILAIVVEELGLCGFIFFLILYAIILSRLLYYALYAKSEGYKLLLIGNASYLIIHFILNVGGVSGFIPLTGVPLLFMSSGGSSLMSIMISIGISQPVISQMRRQAE